MKYIGENAIKKLIALIKGDLAKKQDSITVSGLLKGDGTTISAAVAETDYMAPPTGGTTGQILKKTETGTEWADVPQTVTILETTALLKGDGNGGVSAAVAGTDYMAPVIGGTTGQVLTKTADGQKWQDHEKSTFIVTIYGDSGTGYTTDKTFLEIQEAYDAGKVCFISYRQLLLPMTSLYRDTQAMFFTFLEGNAFGGFIITVSNEIVYDYSFTQGQIEASGLLKGDGDGGISSATAGTDYVAPNGDASNVTAAFTAASTRANIATGEKLSVLFGKIAKWFSDLGSLAFKSKVAKSDLASDVQTSLGKADSALQSAPVTSVNGETGEVTVSVPTVPTTTSLIKGNGSGGLVAATRGSDYIASGNIVKQTLVATETTPTENYAINWVYGN